MLDREYTHCSTYSLPMLRCLRRKNRMPPREPPVKEFPNFMQRAANRVPAAQQNTPDIDGCYYTAQDGSQMAFWTCNVDRESKDHVHDYDEYVICVQGTYTVTIDGQTHVLHSGDEAYIPAGALQGGSCTAGTRTIHAFGGPRIL